MSARAYTTPLQMVLSTRRSLMSKLNTDVNSFEAVEADGGRQDSKPVSFDPTAADMRCRVRRHDTAAGSSDLFSTKQSNAVAGNTAASDVSRAKLRRGSLSHADFAKASLLLQGDQRLLKRLARANCFDVVGGVTQGEVDLLEPAAPGDRAFVVQTWIVRLMTNRLAAGGLAIPPPLLSRTYQVLSDGTAAAMQARKVSYVAFPFPLRQLLVLLLLVFQVIAPMCVAAFMDNEILIGVLSFFVCLGYTALNETAAELEHPFGLGANHLQLTAYQRQFNSKLAHLFDQTIPQLGYAPKAPLPAPPVPPAASSGSDAPNASGKTVRIANGMDPASDVQPEVLPPPGKSLTS